MENLPLCFLGEQPADIPLGDPHGSTAVISNSLCTSYQPISVNCILHISKMLAMNMVATISTVYVVTVIK